MTHPFTPEDVFRVRQLHAAHFGDGYYDYNDLAGRIATYLSPEEVKESCDLYDRSRKCSTPTEEPTV